MVKWDGVIINQSLEMHPKRAEYMKLLSTFGIMRAIEQRNPICMKKKLIVHSKMFLYKAGIISVLKKWKER